jgi:hypothetical protein
MLLKATKCHQKYKSPKSNYIHLLVSTITFLDVKNSTHIKNILVRFSLEQRKKVVLKVTSIQ